MNTYGISSAAGIDLGTYPGETPLDALDALAREAGYTCHAAECVAIGSRGDDWTTDLGAFTRGGISLYVSLENGMPYDVAYHEGVKARANLAAATNAT